MMTLRSACSAILFLFFFQLSLAQTGILKGKVSDASGKELLPGAAIQLVSNT